jgi:urea transporter
VYSKKKFWKTSVRKNKQEFEQVLTVVSVTLHGQKTKRVVASAKLGVILTVANPLQPSVVLFGADCKKSE